MPQSVRTDPIGRPVFATNASGAKVWEASYLPFGGVHVSTGAINLRFPGQWFQSESGLHQNWMRDYDPTTGRYLQADPLGLVDGASVYGYALQSPGRYADHTGECVGLWAPVCAAALGAALNVAIGIVLDQYLGDGCYSWEELALDGSIGAALGPLGLYGKAWGDGGAASRGAGAASVGDWAVYTGVGAGGIVRYVGMTSRTVGTRAAEHWAESAAKAALRYGAVSTGLTKQAARVLEQQLINQYGLARNGGTLFNRINSIAPKF